MRILSKYKDYYDFVAGPEADSIIVYDRKLMKVVSKQHYDYLKEKNNVAEYNASYPLDYIEPFRYVSSLQIPTEAGAFVGLAFCDNLYNIFLTKDNEYIYNFEDFVNIVDPKKKFSFTREYGKTFWHNQGYKPFVPFESTKTDLNKTIGFPIIVDKPYEGILLNHKLSDIHFGSIKTAIECYQEIYNWLSDRKPVINIPDSPDDMSRYEAKGFDKKQSFRNIK